MIDQNPAERKTIVKGLDPEALSEAIGLLGVSEVVEPGEQGVYASVDQDRSNETVNPDIYMTEEQLRDFMQKNRIYAGQFKISLRYFQKESFRHLSADKNWRTPPTPEERQEFEAELETLRHQGVEVHKDRNHSGYHAYYFDTSSGPIQTLRFDPETHKLQLNMSGLKRLSDEAQDPRRLNIQTSSFVKSSTGQLFMGAANVMFQDSSSDTV